MTVTSPDVGTPELQTTPSYSRGDVSRAFGLVYRVWERSLESLKQKNPTDLTAEERKQLSDYQITSHGLNEVGNKKEGFVIQFEHDNRQFTVTEGIPIEGMIDFLNAQISQLESQSSLKTKEKQKLEKYKNWREILFKNSLTYKEAREKSNFPITPDFQHARTSLEAVVGYQDSLRKSENPDDTTRMKEDWESAEKALNERRRELRLPDQKPKEKRQAVIEQADEKGGLAFEDFSEGLPGEVGGTPKDVGEKAEGEVLTPPAAPAVGKEIPEVPPTGSATEPQTGGKKIAKEPGEVEEVNRVGGGPPGDRSGERVPKTTPTVPTEIETGFVGLKQRIEHTTDTEKKVKGMETLDERGREIGRQQMAEDRKKWEGRFSFLKQLIPRFWKYSVGDIPTYAKEKRHGIKLLAESGIQLTTLPAEFLREVDDLAREQVKEGRKGIFRKAWGGMKDLFHEATFTEKELHDKRIEVMKLLRQGLEGSTDPEVLEFFEKNKDLSDKFALMLSADFTASESMARRIADKFGYELIHKGVGETKGAEAVVLEGPVKKMLLDNIMQPLIANGLANGGKVSEDVLMKARRSMQEFFFQKEFITWYYAQSPDVRNALKLSLSYGSDLIPMVQEVILPQLVEAKAHGDGASNIEEYINTLVLKVHVGTLESGQKGIINEGKIEKATSRGITNERVLSLYQELRDADTAPKLVPDTYLAASVKRANLLGALGAVATNDVIMGIATGVGLYAIKAGARSFGRMAVPVIGGSAISAVLRVMQERRLFTREYEEHEVETETGYNFSTDQRRREQMRKIEFHKRQMQSGLTDKMKPIVDKLQKGENISEDEAQKLLGFMADTKARFDLSDQRGVGFLASSNPQSYQVEKTNLEMMHYTAKAELRQYLGSHPDVLTKLGTDFGVVPANMDTILKALVDAQSENLLHGTGIDTKLDAALGNLKISEKESIDAREKAFKSMRRYRMAKAGLVTMAGGVGGYVASRALINAAAHVAADTNLFGLRPILEQHGWIKQQVVGSHEVALKGAVEAGSGVNVQLPPNFHQAVVGNDLVISDDKGLSHIFNITKDVKGNITGLTAADPKESLVSHFVQGTSHEVKVPGIGGPLAKLSADVKALLGNPAKMETQHIFETQSPDKVDFHVLWPEYVKVTGDHAGHELEGHWPGDGFIHWRAVINKDAIDSHLGLEPRHDVDLERLINLSPDKHINPDDVFCVMKLRTGERILGALDKSGDLKIPQEFLGIDGKPNPKVFEWIGFTVMEKANPAGGTELISASDWVAGGHQHLTGITDHFLASEKFTDIPLPPPPEETIKTIFDPALLDLGRREDVTESFFSGTDFGVPIYFPRRPLEKPEKAGEIPGPTPYVPNPLEEIAYGRPYGRPYGAGYGRTSGGISSSSLSPDMVDVLRPADEVLGIAGPTSGAPSTVTPTVMPTAAAPVSTTTPAAAKSTPPTVTTTPPTTTSTRPPVPTPGATTVSLEQLQNFLVDETQTPVVDSDRDKARERAEQFVNSNEVTEAQDRGGMSKTIAADLFKKILLWYKANNIVSLEADDPSLTPAIRARTEELVRTYYDSDDPETIRKKTNLIAKFARDNGMFDVTTGDTELNLYAMVVLFDKVKDIGLT